MRSLKRLVRKFRRNKHKMASVVIITFACLCTLSVSGVAHAGETVPEIDPGSMAGAMTLLGGSLLMMFDRRKSS